MEVFAGFGVVLTLFLVLMAALWTCLPFAMFGIKPRLDRITGEQRASADVLRQRIGQLQAVQMQAPGSAYPRLTVGHGGGAANPTCSERSGATAAPATPTTSAHRLFRARVLATRLSLGLPVWHKEPALMEPRAKFM